MNRIRVRKACLGDLDAVKALTDANRSALGFTLRPALAAGIQKGWLLVVEQAGQVIGFAHYRHRRDSQTTLYELCVEETRRRNGVGRSLIQTLIAETIALGKTLIRLKAPVDLPANEFYRKLGFTLTGVQQGRQRQLNIWEIQLGDRRTET